MVRRTLLSAPPKGRILRSPKHTFQVARYAFELQPFMIAPVLPGETMENLYFEARSVSDPVKNKLIGWMNEYRFFYVRVTDLLNDAIRDMFIDPTNTDLAATLGIGANQTLFYTAKGGINYVQLAYRKIVNFYFRDTPDDYADFVSGRGLSYAQYRDKYWLDSVTDSDDMPVGPDPDTANTMSELEALQMAYQQLQSLGIADMTYEDWLRSYGLSIPSKDENEPELLASFSDWQYPTNTINPVGGGASSALSWVFKNSQRDPKQFKEPGFIVGIACTRPKVYFGGLAGNLTAHLSRAWDWVPNYMNEAAAEPMPMSSLKKFAADTGPLGDRTVATEAYWVDMRDLFLHGDQWQAILAAADPPVANGLYNVVSEPAVSVANNSWKYPSSASTDAEAKSFFVTGGSEFIRDDGMVSLSIRGRQVDYTVGKIADF